MIDEPLPGLAPTPPDPADVRRVTLHADGHEKILGQDLPATYDIPDGIEHLEVHDQHGELGRFEPSPHNANVWTYRHTRFTLCKIAPPRARGHLPR